MTQTFELVHDVRRAEQMTPIDLRSDTVTRPTAGMRAAIAAAEVGDIQYDDDPSVNRLEARVAELLGKEAALWLPSGTQANQVALLVLTRRGDDVIVAREAHSVWHETGGSGGIAGVQLTEIGDRGVFTADEFRRAIKPRNHPIYPPTTLVEIENTHNRMGGVIFPQPDAIAICAAAREHGIASYLDGARLWNVAVATGTPVAELAAPFDLAMVSMSKGLGAPGGSLLAGSRDLIGAAVRYRRMLGGAMRQVGLFAAAASYALDHHVARLAEDHDHAQRLARLLARSPRIRIDADAIQTNVLVFDLEPAATAASAAVPDAHALVARARERGVLINALSATRLRALTHLDTPWPACETAGRALVEILDGAAG
ncbi:MAG: low specificity L-threonine aldolase [Lautropia sp.]